MFRAFGLKTQETQKSENQFYKSEPLKEIIPIEEKVNRYIDNQRVVLWGRFFDVNSKEGRRQAKEFILDLLIDLELTNELVE